MLQIMFGIEKYREWYEILRKSKHKASSSLQK